MQRKTRAAIEEGVVAGGGVTYINAVKTLEKLEKAADENEKLGYSIVRKALYAPMTMILHNAGLEPSVIIEKVKQPEEIRSHDNYNGGRACLFYCRYLLE